MKSSSIYVFLIRSLPGSLKVLSSGFSCLSEHDHLSYWINATVTRGGRGWGVRLLEEVWRIFPYKWHLPRNRKSQYKNNIILIKEISELLKWHNHIETMHSNKHNINYFLSWALVWVFRKKYAESVLKECRNNHTHPTNLFLLCQCLATKPLPYDHSSFSLTWINFYQSMDKWLHPL